MQQSRILPVSRCLVDRRYADKAACLGDLANCAASEAGIDRIKILEALHRREALGSTGVGEGVALPHARLQSIAEPIVILARLKRAVSFDAVDGSPVDIVCLLLLPDESGGQDLSLLARCARALRDKQTVAAIRAASGPASLATAMKLDDYAAGEPV